MPPLKIHLNNLNIFYGYRCNYSCDGCFSGSDAVKTEEFDPSVEEILESIPFLKEKVIVKNMVTLMGGEPWLYWEEKIIPISLSVNQHYQENCINIFTNGQLLGKNIDKFIDLSKQVSAISLTVTRHLDPVLDSLPGQIWQKSIELMSDHPEIFKISDDHYHVKGNIKANIYFNHIQTWQPSYQKIPTGEIKPFATQDPNGSFQQRCNGSGCTCTFGKKLYKCPSLGSLKSHLSALGQYTDPDWQKYLLYQPLDITNADENEIQSFKDQLYKAVDQCDMCNNKDWSEISGNMRTVKMIFQK
jgi:organic radical activating enzyme